MCVIAVKPVGQEIPSDTIMKQMWDKNSDGAGFMYAYQGKVHIEKGFMTYEEFKTALNGFKERITEDLPMVFHFRITTHGGTSRENTHPFPISNKEKHLKGLDVVCPVGVSHNGVIRSVDAETDMSDTMVYIREIMYPLRRIDKQFYNTYKTLLSTTIGTSKLAFLEGDGTITMIGNFTEKEGIHYSNTYYIPTVYNYDNTTTRSYIDWTSYYNDPEYDFKEGDILEFNDIKDNGYYSYLKGKDLHFISKIGSYAKVTIYYGDDVSYDRSVPVYLLKKKNEETKVKEEVKVQPDTIGGRKNKEMFGIKQKGNIKDYIAVPDVVLQVKPIPSGFQIGSWEDYDVVKASIEPQATVNNTKGSWFITEDEDFLYRTKTGMVYVIECVDVFWEKDSYWTKGMVEYSSYEKLDTPPLELKIEKLYMLDS